MGADFQKGDRVRVTFEGTVTNVFDLGDDSLELKIEPQDNYVQYVSTKIHNVEKVERPVETFGPGDVVRSHSGVIRVLGHDGWMNLTEGAWHKGYNGFLGDFTSDRYERVSLT